MKGLGKMNNNNKKHKVKCLILLVILTGIFFFALNLILNYLILCSSSAKVVKTGPLPADYYSFKLKYLFNPPSKFKIEMSFLMSLVAAFYLVYKYDGEFQRKEKNKNIEGSDRWLEIKELSKKPLKKDILFIDKNNIYAAEKSGIILCETNKGYYVDTSTTSSLIIGTTRSGKTQTFVLPMIRILCSTKNKQSMVINDPKGELLENSYELLKRNGYKIVVLNLRDTSYSSKWNPLSEIIAEYVKARESEEQDFSKTSELIGDLAKVFTDDPHSAPIWPNSAKSLLTAMILYLLEKGYENKCLDKLNMYSVYNFFLEYGSKNEQRVAGKMVVTVNALDELFKALPVGNPAKLAYATSNFSQGDTRSSIFTTLASNIEIFSDNGIGLLTSGNDINFADLVNPDKPCAIFMVVPDEKTNRHVLASLFISQCYSHLVDIANKYPRKILPQRVQFILDEFGNMVRIPDMNTKLTVALGRNIIFNLFLQDLNQLETKYDKSAGTIRSACNNFIYINSIDETTNKFVSSVLGNMTIEYNTFSGTIGEWVKNQNINYKGRPLMTHTEVEKLEFGEAIVKRQRTYALRTRFTPFYELGIPLTDIKDIPLLKNRNKLEDILFPFDVLDNKEDNFTESTNINDNTELDMAIEIADKLTNGEFSCFLSDRDFVSCFDVINHLKANNSMSHESLTILEDFLEAKCNI